MILYSLIEDVAERGLVVEIITGGAFDPRYLATISFDTLFLAAVFLRICERSMVGSTRVVVEYPTTLPLSVTWYTMAPIPQKSSMKVVGSIIERGTLACEQLRVAYKAVVADGMSTKNILYFLLVIDKLVPF